MMYIPALQSVTVSEGTVYNLRFDTHCGWAVVIVSDSTGMLAITSDWGDWSYRWNLRGMPEGKTLTQFLAGVDGDYVARKLLGGAVHTYCPEGTERRWKQEICERRRDGRLDREKAREFFDLVVAFDFDVPALNDFPTWDLDPEPYEFTHTRDSNEYTAVTKIVWPAFQGVLRGRAEARGQEACA